MYVTCIAYLYINRLVLVCIIEVNIAAHNITCKYQVKALIASIRKSTCYGKVLYVVFAYELCNYNFIRSTTYCMKYKIG